MSSYNNKDVQQRIPEDLTGFIVSNIVHKIKILPESLCNVYLLIIGNGGEKKIS